MQHKNSNWNFLNWANRNIYSFMNAEIDMKSFVDRVKERIEFLKSTKPTLKITQGTLARACGVDQPEISKLLNCVRVTIPPYIYELSVALEISVKWLLTGREDTQPGEALKVINSGDVYENLASIMRQIDDLQESQKMSILGWLQIEMLKKTDTSAENGHNETLPHKSGQ